MTRSLAPIKRKDIADPDFELDPCPSRLPILTSYSIFPLLKRENPSSHFIHRGAFISFSFLFSFYVAFVERLPLFKQIQFWFLWRLLHDILTGLPHHIPKQKYTIDPHKNIPQTQNIVRYSVKDPRFNHRPKVQGQMGLTWAPLPYSKSKHNDCYEKVVTSSLIMLDTESRRITRGPE